MVFSATAKLPASRIWRADFSFAMISLVSGRCRGLPGCVAGGWFSGVRDNWDVGFVGAFAEHGGDVFDGKLHLAQAHDDAGLLDFGGVVEAVAGGVVHGTGDEEAVRDRCRVGTDRPVICENSPMLVGIFIALIL